MTIISPGYNCRIINSTFFSYTTYLSYPMNNSFVSSLFKVMIIERCTQTHDNFRLLNSNSTRPICVHLVRNFAKVPIEHPSNTPVLDHTAASVGVGSTQPYREPSMFHSRLL